ncbi:hypothetical protein [Paenibacillus qinlingensis]|uniref:Uncharacterized protein n=1 Tax=Paenibacillus qinlingensis TaxID=1837343 RepID=A0ABU1NRM9_9BACL|nr:hypothetical protein [Paenibacillus qinlingensis]MDR6549677.1 hypothetical protein [Paenibacillus qinlingensis]
MGLEQFGKANCYEMMDEEEVREAVNFTSHDVIIIERALRTAMKHDREEHRTRDYQEVLVKMQESANQALSVTAQMTSDDLDGFRYDYDDSADLM